MNSSYWTITLTRWTSSDRSSTAIFRLRIDVLAAERKAGVNSGAVMDPGSPVPIHIIHSLKGLPGSSLRFLYQCGRQTEGDVVALTMHGDAVVVHVPVAAFLDGLPFLGGTKELD